MHEVFEAFFERVAGSRAPRDHGRRTCRSRANVFVRRRRSRAREAPGRRGRARAHAAARFVGRGGPRRSRLPDGSRARRAGRRAAARALELSGRFTIATTGGDAMVRSARQGGSHRSAGRRHVPADRLQARMAARPERVRCSCRSTVVCAEQRLAGHLGRTVDARRSGLPRVQGAEARRAAVRERRGARRGRSPRRSNGSRHHRRDRARRIPADAGRRVPLRDVQLRRRSAGRTTSAMSDAEARAITPSIRRSNVVLEASAGTGKTRVLVERYVNLLRAGVDPDHILAITFTRKAAAEMRDRIIERLREASRTVGDRHGALARSQGSPRRHRHLDDRRVLPVAAARVSARSRRRSRASTLPTTPRSRA